MRLVAVILVVLSWGCIVCPDAVAHESQPASLELRQLEADRYELTWRAPIYYGHPHPARLALPGTWHDLGSTRESTGSDYDIFERTVEVGPKGVDGCVIRFPGLQSTTTDVFVRLERLDGSTMTAIVRPWESSVRLRGERGWWATATQYLALGFHHILGGVDHLLFVLGLMLIVHGRRMLLKTITAFTVAHSLTLALATLGVASVPLPPLNAAIALSILFLGPEIVRTWRGESSLTIRAPWVVAFLFGMLHGFGFASGLSTTGMPRAEIPQALLFFNVGVELGQLVIVFVALALVRSFRILEIRWPRAIALLPGYVVGGLGAFWAIQRTAILLERLHP